MDANTRQSGGHPWEIMGSRASDWRDGEPRVTTSRSPAHAVERVPGVDAAVRRHEGSFAAGQELTEHHPELLREKGNFASGEELRVQAHQGTFAAGQERADPHPEVLENRGGFAAGQRRLTDIRGGQRSVPSFS